MGKRKTSNTVVEEFYSHITDNFAMEQWKSVDGFPKYEVSNYGRVRRTVSKGSINGGLLSPLKHKLGYLLINLSRGTYGDGEQKMMSLHRLVALHWVDGYADGLEVNHIDENKWNCTAVNLEWLTHRENINHGTGRQRSALKRSKPVAQLDKDGQVIREWISATEAGQNGYTKSSVCACCNARQKTHKGYFWKYL